MVLVPLPLGYFIRQRIVAFIAYIAVHAFTFTFQTALLVRAWVGGSAEAFPQDPMRPPWAYLFVNARQEHPHRGLPKVRRVGPDARPDGDELR